MSASSQIRPSTYGATSVEEWISTSSVQTTAQPPSAFTPRMTACAVGWRWPIPLQCGTWKKRLRAVTGPIGTGSKRTSKRGSRTGPPGVLAGRAAERLRRSQLVRVDERDRGRRAGQQPVLGVDLQPVSRVRERDRHPDVADVSLQAGRPDRRRDAADLGPVAVRRPDPGDAGQRFRVVEDDPHELAVDPFPPRPFECRLADVVLLLLLDEPLEAHDVEGRVAQRHGGAVVEDPRLDPPRLALRDGAAAGPVARGDDRVPEIGAAAGVEEVHLEARHRRPAGPADHDRDAVDLDPVAPVVAELVDLVADECLERRGRLRPLHLD